MQERLQGAKVMAGMSTGSFLRHMPIQALCSAPVYSHGPADCMDQQSANCRTVEADGPRQEKNIVSAVPGKNSWSGT